jgi:hypothetical protein
MSSMKYRSILWIWVKMDNFIALELLWAGHFGVYAIANISCCTRISEGDNGMGYLNIVLRWKLLHSLRLILMVYGISFLDLRWALGAPCSKDISETPLFSFLS